MKRATRKAVLAALAALLTVGSGLSARAAEKINTQYLLDNAVAVATVGPRAVLTLPNMKMMPVEVFSAAGKKELGIDPLDVEQVLVQAVAPAVPGMPPGVGVVVRFTKPYQLDKILPNLAAQTEAAQLGGKPYRQATKPMGLSMMMPDDKTLLLGTGDMLSKMLAPQQGTNKLGRILGNMPADHRVVALVDVASLRAPIGQLMAQLPPLPPPLAQFKQLPDLTDTLALRLGVDQKIKQEIVFIAADAQAAAKLQQLVDQALTMGKQMLQAKMMEDAPKGDDPVDVAMRQYMMRMTDALFESLKPQVQGTRVTVTVESDLGMSGTGMMAALMLPAVQAAREAARRSQSSNNLKLIGLAMFNYHDAHRHFPAQAITDKEGKPLLSWRVQVLPFLEQQALYNQFHLDEPWDSEHNKKLIAQIPAVYRSPGSEAEPGKANYVVPVGKGTIFGGEKSAGFPQITDGTSNTVLALEVDDKHAVIWTKPEDWQYNPKDPTAGLKQWPGGAIQLLFADGSVRAVMADVFKKLADRLLVMNDGQRVDLP